MMNVSVPIKWLNSYGQFTAEGTKNLNAMTECSVGMTGRNVERLVENSTELAVSPPLQQWHAGSESMLLEPEASDANHKNSPFTCGKPLAKPRICKGYDNNTSEMSASQVC